MPWRLNAELFRSERDSLCMVPGTGAYDTLSQHFFRKGGHQVVGAANFIGSYYLQVFPLEQDGAAIFFRQMLIHLKRGCIGNPFQANFGFINIFHPNNLLGGVLLFGNHWRC